MYVGLCDPYVLQHLGINHVMLVIEIVFVGCGVAMLPVLLGEMRFSEGALDFNPLSPIQQKYLLTPITYIPSFLRSYLSSNCGFESFCGGSIVVELNFSGRIAPLLRSIHTH